MSSHSPHTTTITISPCRSFSTRGESIWRNIIIQKGRINFLRYASIYHLNQDEKVLWFPTSNHTAFYLLIRWAWTLRFALLSQSCYHNDHHFHSITYKTWAATNLFLSISYWITLRNSMFSCQFTFTPNLTRIVRCVGLFGLQK